MPGSAARASEDLERLGLDDVPGGEPDGGIEIPCTARSETRSQPASNGIRQSRPITSPPATAIFSSSVAVPVPEWIVGTSTAERTRAEWGATYSR